MQSNESLIRGETFFRVAGSSDWLRLYEVERLQLNQEKKADEDDALPILARAFFSYDVEYPGRFEEVPFFLELNSRYAEQSQQVGDEYEGIDIEFLYSDEEIPLEDVSLNPDEIELLREAEDLLKAAGKKVTVEKLTPEANALLRSLIHLCSKNLPNLNIANACSKINDLQSAQDFEEFIQVHLENGALKIDSRLLSGIESTLNELIEHFKASEGLE